MKYFKGLFLSNYKGSKFMNLKSKILFFIPVIVIIMSLFYVITMYINENRIRNNNSSIREICFHITNINTNIYNEMYDILINKSASQEYDELYLRLTASSISEAIEVDINSMKSDMEYISYNKTEKEYEIFKDISFRLNEILDDYKVKKENGYLVKSELKDIFSYYNNLSNNLIEIVKSLGQIYSDEKRKKLINDYINIMYLAHNIGLEIGNSVIMAYTKDFINNYNDFTSAISKQNEYIPLIQKILEEYENGFVFDVFNEANNSFDVKELREYIHNSYKAQSQNNNQQIDDFYFMGYNDITFRLDVLKDFIVLYTEIFVGNNMHTPNPYEKFIKALVAILIAYIIFLIVFAIRNRKKSIVKTSVTLNDDNFIKK